MNFICSFQDKQHGRGCNLKRNLNHHRNSLNSRRELIRIRHILDGCKETRDSQLDLDGRIVFVILPICKLHIDKHPGQWHHRILAKRFAL